MHKPTGAPSTAEVLLAIGLDRGRRQRPWLLVGIGLVALGSAAALALGHLKHRADSTARRYTTAMLVRDDLEVTVTATGTLQSRRTIEVGSEVSGRMQFVYVEPNDVVHKGQVLGVIDPEQLRAAAHESEAQLAAAEAAIRQAKATREEARAAAARAKKQAAEGLYALKDLETAIATAERAEAGVQSAIANAEVARATLTSTGSKLSRATLVAPVDGIVLSRAIEPGQTVTAGFTTPVLFKIAEDLTRMKLEVDVDEADVGRVREGQLARFTVEAYPQQIFPSRVISLRNEPKTSQNVVTYQAILWVDNGGKLLRPGMTATATIIADVRRSVLVVPNAALRFKPPAPRGLGVPPSRAQDGTIPGEKAVYVLDGNGPRGVPVKVGASDGTRTELLAPSLPAGSRVIVDLVGED